MRGKKDETGQYSLVRQGHVIHSGFLHRLIGDTYMNFKRKYTWTITHIVSGGQTGADRAALDWAIQHQISHGGWCPRSRCAEDGSIDEKYQLMETPSSEYEQRTEWNVRDSDGTVIFSIEPRLIEGSYRTLEFARKYHKPYLRLYRQGSDSNLSKKLLTFLQKHKIRVLNIAGPRASIEPEVGAFVMDTLEKAFIEGSN